MKIISRYFYDRNSGLRWMIRNDPQHAREAAAVAMVLALGVTFAESSSFEAGFGCSVVAYAESAEHNSDAWEVREYREYEGAERITFNGTVFIDKDGAIVTGCDRLFLLGDGTMYGTGLRYELGNLTGYGSYLSWKTLKPDVRPKLSAPGEEEESRSAVEA